MSVFDKIDQSTQLITVVGPTASGKSDFAIELARNLSAKGHNVAIINADSYALYKYMDIGTAKVPKDVRDSLLMSCGIEHYQIDVLEPTEISNAATYQKETLKIIERLHQNQVIPILCGGSGLYLRAITDNFEFQKVDFDLRAKLENRVKEEGIESLYKELVQKDPLSAKTINNKNSRRIIRALEVIYTTGKEYQSNLPQFINRYQNTIHIGLCPQIDELDCRVEKRTLKMRDSGLYDEVSNLYKNNLFGPTAIKAIGYAQIVSLLNGEYDKADNRPLTIDKAFNNITIQTKRLIRKQLAWFKRDNRIEWI